MPDISAAHQTHVGLENAQEGGARWRRHAASERQHGVGDKGAVRSRVCKVEDVSFQEAVTRAIDAHLLLARAHIYLASDPIEVGEFPCVVGQCWRLTNPPTI